jgi:protein-L-isoaspartate(D-aspartate) O-methyltransferase
MKLAVIIFFLLTGGYIFSQDDKYVSARNSMVKIQLTDRGITDGATIKAMKKVPRHLFVPKDQENNAYGDFPLPIGYGQTISQPYIVAYMTEIVRPTEKKKALEIGTGSGYQAAVLAEIVRKVYTIEIITELAKESASRFDKLGYRNIIQKSGDGYAGWPENAPFDIIIVTAAAKEIPKPLIDQLAENGRLVIPVGEPGAVQELILLIKKNGKIERSRLASVRFVPFRRSENKKN